MKKNSFVFNRTLSKNQIKELVNWFLINYGALRTKNLLDNLKTLGFKYSTLAGISIGVEDLLVPIVKKDLFNSVDNYLKRFDYRYKRGEITLVYLLDKFIQSWTTVSDLLKDEVVLNFKQKNLLNPLYMMTLSGARGNLSQIKQLVGMRGIMSDSQGEIIDLPIKNNFKNGLNIIEYFISCYGARKGLVDTALKTANSGYLTRRLVFVGQSLIIKQPNCFTKSSSFVYIDSLTKISFNSLKAKLLGRILSKDLLYKETNKLLASLGQDICNYLLKKLIKLKKVYIRSPLTCGLKTGFCQLCYGWNLANGKIIQLGETVGIIAAQSIGEPGTQLTMRTFHTGGIFSGEGSETILSPDKGVIFFQLGTDIKKLYTKYGEKAFYTTSSHLLYLFNKKGDIYTISVPSNSLFFVKPGQTVFFKQLLAQFSIHNDISSSSAGILQTVNSVKAKFSGLTFKLDTSLWILSSNLINYAKLSFYVSNNNKKNSKLFFLKGKKLNKNIFSFNRVKHISFSYVKRITLETYFLEKLFGDISVFSLSRKKSNKFLKLESSSLKPGDFLLENELLGESLKNEFSFILLQKQRGLYFVRKASPFFVPENSVMLKNNFSPVKRGSYLFNINYNKKKTEDIVQGLPKVEEFLEARKPLDIAKEIYNPHLKLSRKFHFYKQKYNNEIAVKKSFDFIQRFLVNKILGVYIAQGVDISYKHMEIIVKQMTSKVLIVDSGRSNFIVGEIVDFNKVLFMKDFMLLNVKYEPILVGITKLSLMSNSFISQASFQETTKVLSRSALEGKVDWLYGLKENLVLGNIIPAGTGFKCA